MKFLADVNIPNSSINLLKKLGHQVIDIKKDYLLIKDVQIIKLAKQENGIILTRDKDFLELNKIPKYKIPLIAIRIRNQKFENISARIKNLLENQTEEILKNSITIVSEDVVNSYPLLSELSLED